ncbi:MAG: hypothetical protein PF444_07345, partial [Bacteroidales bacterium]|nr:hypothetical protein [Bacteroidales bacterium]
MFKNQRILICPLNWGFGHSTRMVAYAKQLELAGNHMMVAGDHEVLDIFKEELPHIERILLKDIHVHYSKSDKQERKLVLSSPLFMYLFYQQHLILKRLLKRIEVDIVISDNRPSLWSKKVKSYYVTHQPTMKLSDGWHWAEKIATHTHQWFIKHYDALLIPDVPGSDNLSGEMSFVKEGKFTVHYIGWLSRFEKPIVKVEPENYTLLILSGVEPSRTHLRDEIIKRFKGTEEQLIIAGGNKAETHDNIIT